MTIKGKVNISNKAKNTCRSPYRTEIPRTQKEFPLQKKAPALLPPRQVDFTGSFPFLSSSKNNNQPLLPRVFVRCTRKKSVK
jgi:hypothetical protein